MPDQPVIRSTSRLIAMKEFREIFRDRRTIISVVISPLLVTPAIFALLGILIGRQTEKAKTQDFQIGVVGPPESLSLLTKSGAALHLHFNPVATAEAEESIKSRKLQAVLKLPADFTKRLAQNNTVTVELLKDAGEERSQQAEARVNQLINSLSRSLIEQRLRVMGLSNDFADPFRIVDKPIQKGGSPATFLLAMMLTYMLAISAFSGGIYAAFDQVAGEKERGTLETLLVSPASRSDIVMGKFASVVAVCMISSILSVAGLVLTFTLPIKAFSWLSQGGLHLSPTAMLVTLVAMLPLSVLFAGLLLAVSTFARNQKEAQTYLAPLFLAVIMPSMASMFLSADVPRSVALVPVLNASIIIKQTLSGSDDPTFILMAFAASAFYAYLALLIATRLFQKESVLIKN